MLRKSPWEKPLPSRPGNASLDGSLKAQDFLHKDRWGFHRGYPIDGWFLRETPTKMDDLGYPYFRKPPDHDMQKVLKDLQSILVPSSIPFRCLSRHATNTSSKHSLVTSWLTSNPVKATDKNQSQKSSQVVCRKRKTIETY